MSRANTSREFPHAGLVAAIKDKDEAKITEYLEGLTDDNINLSIDHKDNNLLHIAAEYGTPELVEKLIDRGGNVNALNFSQYTPLHVALEQKKSGNANILIDRGANLYAKDAMERTPLYIAIDLKLTDVVKKIIESGADINMKLRKDRTALHVAVAKNDIEVVTALIDRGADVNASGHLRKTALDYAIDGENKEVAKILIENGADANIPNLSGLLGMLDRDTAASLLTKKDKDGKGLLDLYVEKHCSDMNPDQKKEAQKIAKHIGGILRDKGLARSTDLWQRLTDTFQRFCEAVGINTERKATKELLLEDSTAIDMSSLAGKLKVAFETAPKPQSHVAARGGGGSGGGGRGI